MTEELAQQSRRNIVLVSLFIAVLLFTAFHEGYVPLISLTLWGSIGFGLALSLWLAFRISTARLVSLMLIITFLEYVKESIGIRSGMWVYHGIKGFYLFGVWLWVLAGLAVFTLSTQIVIPRLRHLTVSPPKWVNPVLLILLYLVILLTIGPYAPGASVLFWSFYTIVLIYGLYVSLNMGFATLAGLVLTAWLGGNISEYVGSVASQAWTFPQNPMYPPLYLLFGCWPLEVVAQYALSGFLAGETLEPYP